MDLKLLKKPFPEHKIHWRVGATTTDKSKGIALAYIDARDVMDRLDEVCGSENWQVRHPREGYCEIGINVRPSASIIAAGTETHNYIEPHWVFKGNGAGETDYESTKGQFSDSMKRAAVEWGIGRYLYGLPNEWVNIKKAGKSYKLVTSPKLPDWATPNPKTGLKKADRDAFFEAAMELLAAGDVDGFNQMWVEYDMDEKVILWSCFNSEQRTAIRKFKDGE